jgi:hypothetical protein
MTNAKLPGGERLRTEPRDPVDTPCSLLAVLGQEFKALHPGAPLDDSSVSALYRSIHGLEAAGHEPRAALCLSGGGIRSASFALGILQGLARHDLLLKFHYLSTVSGGGYIGSWLTAWRWHAANDRTVAAALTTRRADPPDEPGEIASLRADSNYLTPHLGLLSADTWTGVAHFIRNLLLNWLVLVPLFAAALLIPLVASRFLDWAVVWSLPWRWGVLGVALLLLTAGQTIAIACRPGEGRRGIDQAHFLVFVLLPIYLGATFLSVLAAQVGHVFASATSADSWPIADSWWLAAGTGAVVYALSWLLGFAARLRAGRTGKRHARRFDPVPPWRRFIRWTIIGALAGLCLRLGLKLWIGLVEPAVARHWPNEPQLGGDSIVVFGVAWVVLSMMIGEMLYVGLTSYTRNGDADREWLARASGWIVAVTLLWVCLSGLVLFGPTLVRDLVFWLLPLLGGASGIASALIGRSTKTAASLASGKPSGLPMALVARVAAVVFLLCLALFLSFILVPLLAALEVRLGLGAHSPGRNLLAVAAVLLLGGLSFGASFFINVNRFSLHAVYRNRLVRAFLGAARASQWRHPDAFTGFDLDDNVRVHKLWNPIPGEAGVAARLLHVINMTLNVVHTTNLAWQQRKAETFTVTPFAAGNPYVGFRPASSFGGPRGITLGTAMAISGAAASPNMGYHSSSLIGLMMTLFNVRLGWWLGNPRHPSTWQGEGPTIGISAILRELFGLTEDESPYVYLSDGGHFENLGIYEMMRRRCRYIVVSDAGCDPDCVLGDLGDAVRKIRIDLGIAITFSSFHIKPRPKTGEGWTGEACYCAIAEISYPEAGAEPGWLIYIKPTLCGIEPADVLSYAAASETFPHESTADQWFSESQLESYRALGSHIVDEVWKKTAPAGQVPRGSGLADLLDRACRHAGMASPAVPREAPRND